MVSIKASMAMADTVSWCCAIALITLILISSIKDGTANNPVRGRQLQDRPCDEIYVVREGETLHTISDKCGDPYIVERNPHIHDPDDVFPGLVIRITPTNPRLKLQPRH
ncbi:uncharacterized protein LOC111408890 [Olea europaea var. sylvestris]|uniref:uncharacterized protein LOC111408890 n=1 Tax=Olea europaea var. sylvestris TaxID=158386 RepID=UPI000C1D2285|nr:uncharacterized protein LOC111408890 [Olea europaea var. sylvestris]